MSKECLLLLNLGTPDSTKVSDVKEYLSEFLNDPRVIDLPFVQRNLLVNGIIVPFRAPKSAKEYEKIFAHGNGRSPLLVYTEQLTEKVRERLQETHDTYFAMRYGNPCIENVLREIEKKQYSKITVLPLYPQYASATTGSTIEEVMRVIMNWNVIPSLEMVGQFYDDLGFIKCVSEQGNKFNIEDYDHVVFSYHGLPQRQVDTTHLDQQPCTELNCCMNTNNQFCYKAACFETSRLVIEDMGIPAEKCTTAFQSRLGKTPWIQPYTEDTILELAKKGVKKILMFSPAFVADCLETTIECGEEYDHVFKEAGGEGITLVPSLNAEDSWADYLANKVK